MSKHSVSIKLLLILQLTIGNPIQFTELVAITYIGDEIIERIDDVRIYARFYHAGSQLYLCIWIGIGIGKIFSFIPGIESI